MTIFIILLLIMIVGALVATYVRDLLSAVVSLGIVGLTQSVTMLLLGAPDLAIVQLVVEILTLIILIRATISKDISARVNGPREFLVAATGIFFVLSFLLISYHGLRHVSAFGHPAMRISHDYLQQGLAQTGAANIVSAIILNYRAFDTLGEATILFAAVIGVYTVLREVGRKKSDEQK